jgi:hypothetical protein
MTGPIAEISDLIHIVKWNLAKLRKFFVLAAAYLRPPDAQNYHSFRPWGVARSALIHSIDLCLL